MKNIFILLFLILGLISISCGKTSSSNSNIVITGSSSVAPLMFELASKFEELNTNSKVIVETSASTIGIQDTITGNNDIGMASRDLKEDEMKELDYYLLCRDGIVIIVNKKSKLDKISEEELYNLYINNIPVLDISKAISREDGSGTRSSFAELTSIGKYELFPATVEILEGTGKVKTSVSTDPSKLGYISLGAVDDSIKVLKYQSKGQSDYIEPSLENIKANNYKLYRPFYIFTKKNVDLNENIKKFLDFLNTEEAKNIINSHGYISN